MKIIIMGEPHYGNLGDHAIFIAEKLLIQQYFKEYQLQMVHDENLDICSKKVKDYINNEDIIMLQGGGNFGDTYVRPEKGRREVIKNFPNNKIIMFPQTVFFSNTINGKKELEISKKIYNNHNNLVLIAREKKSYEFMKKHFYNSKVYLSPDIAMTLHFKANKARNNILLLFRTDKEKTLKDNEIKLIENIVKEKYNKYKISDMNLGSGIRNIGGKYREKLLKEKIEEFQTSKLVITDRLHGMIFAAITETPCIVFGSLDYKIAESYYNWLKDLKYIKYCENIKDFKKIFNEIEVEKKFNYDNSFAKKKILNILECEIKNRE